MNNSNVPSSRTALQAATSPLSEHEEVALGSFFNFWPKKATLPEVFALVVSKSPEVGLNPVAKTYPGNDVIQAIKNFINLRNYAFPAGNRPMLA